MCDNQLLTGILEARKNSRRASSDPSVDACTNTPLSDSLIDPRTSLSASLSSS